jgi:hypothetical protein
MRPGIFAALAIVPLLAACGGSGGTVQSASLPVRPPQHLTPPRPQVQMLPGLEGVIGATAPDLARQFGPSRLDVREGDARKLQFTGTPCILDVYLYPPAAGRAPHAPEVVGPPPHRRAVDRAACIAALRQR